METNIFAELLRIFKQEAALHQKQMELDIEKIKLIQQIVNQKPMGLRDEQSKKFSESAYGKYTRLRSYIEERLAHDDEFKGYYETHSRVELCTRLTRELGWVIYPYALGRNVNRSR